MNIIVSHSVGDIKKSLMELDLVLTPGSPYPLTKLLRLSSLRAGGGLNEDQLAATLCRCGICGKFFTQHIFYSRHSRQCLGT